MDNGRFGPPIGSSSSEGDRFGYFGGTPEPGAATGQPGASPFGAPPRVPRARRPLKKRVIVLVLLLSIVVVGYFAGTGYLRTRPVTMPSTFAGLGVDTEPAAQSAVSTLVASLKAKNPGVQMNGQIYGAGPQAVILAAARAPDNAAADLTGSDLQPAVVLGANTCAQAVGHASSICMRSDANLTVVVLALGGSPVSTSQLLDQAWTQF